MILGRFPGYLYAKSLSPKDVLSPEYSEYFMHSEIAGYRDEIRKVKNSFSWMPNRTKCWSPILALKLVSRENCLAVRFCDVGTDEFNRTQTLRVEAILLPSIYAGRMLEKMLEVIPEVESATYSVFTPDEECRSVTLDGEWKYFGDKGSFRLSGIDRSYVEDNQFVEDTQDRKDLASMSVPFGKGGNKALLFIMFAVLVSLGGVAYYQYDKNQELQWRYDKVRRELDVYLMRENEISQKVEEQKIQAERISRVRTAVKRLTAEVNNLNNVLDGK